MPSPSSPPPRPAGATYRVDLSAPTGAKHVPQLFKRTELKVPHDPTDYETKQVCVAVCDCVTMLLCAAV